LINSLILDKVVAVLQDKLIDDFAPLHIPDPPPDPPLPVAPEDPARAGVVFKGPLQGDPEPDTARISITVHENDPDNFFSGQVTQITGDWSDEVAEVECGGGSGGAIWNRRFTVKGRCLLVNSKEGLDDTREIASTVKTRIERALRGIDWSDVFEEDENHVMIEYVSRPVLSMRSEAVQGGGPPDSYDYFIKVRFDVQTIETF
jgi:hypothetical protein